MKLEDRKFVNVRWKIGMPVGETVFDSTGREKDACAPPLEDTGDSTSGLPVHAMRRK